MVQRFYGLWYTLALFLSTLKLEKLQITVLKWSRNLRKIISIFKRHFPCYCPNLVSKFLWMVGMFSGVWYTIHAFLSNIKMEQLQNPNDQMTLVKLSIFSKDIFTAISQNIFSKFFWMVYRFHSLWYTFPASFVEYWTEVITDLVSNRSRDVIKLLPLVLCKHRFKFNLLLSGIYDEPKQISEYYEYFESFQSNIQLEKDYGLILDNGDKNY